MNEHELTVYVAELRAEFAQKYAMQREACDQAVLAMRRLALAEALLDTYHAGPPALLATEQPSTPAPTGAIPVTSIVVERDPATSTWNLTDEQVAEVANAALDDGRSVTDALADAFQLTPQGAKAWVARLRRRCLITIPGENHSASGGEPEREPSWEPAGQERTQPELTCPECGKVCQSPAGLGSHRRYAHGVRGGSPAAAGASTSAERTAPQPGVPTVPGRVFRCTDCTLEFPSIRRLVDHALAEHKRPPHPVERTPVEPAETAA